MRVSFASAALAAVPVCQSNSTPLEAETSDILRQLLNKQGQNPFDIITPALSHRLAALNDRITFSVQPPKAHQIEVSLKHTAHVDDTVMHRSFAVSDVANWLEKINQIKDMSTLFVVKEFGNHDVRIVMPFANEVKRLKSQILKAPFYKDGLRPMLQRAQELSQRQNRLDARTMKRYHQERAKQKDMASLNEGQNALWYWKSDISRF